MTDPKLDEVEEPWTKKEDWEVEFDKKFREEYEHYEKIGGAGQEMYLDIIDFIRSLLSLQSQNHKREIERLIDDLETNPNTPQDNTQYTLQYWIEAKQRQLRAKYGK